MKYIIVMFFLFPLLALGEMQRGQVVAINKDFSLSVKDDKGKNHTVVVGCADFSKLNKTQKQQVQQFIKYKTKNNLVVVNTDEKKILINGVEDLTASVLQWGIAYLAKDCKHYSEFSELGRTRKTGIWAK